MKKILFLCSLLFLTLSPLADSPERNEKLLCQIKMKTMIKWISFAFTHDTAHYIVQDKQHCQNIGKQIVSDMDRSPRLWEFLIEEHQSEIALKWLKKKHQNEKIDSPSLIAQNKDQKFWLTESFSIPFKKLESPQNKSALAR